MTCFFSAKALICAVSFRTAVNFMWIFQNASSFFSTHFIQSKWDLQWRDEILAETFNGKRCTSMKINSRVDYVLLAYQLMFYMNALERQRALFGAHALNMYREKFASDLNISFSHQIWYDMQFALTLNSICFMLHWGNIMHSLRSLVSTTYPTFAYIEHKMWYFLSLSFTNPIYRLPSLLRTTNVQVDLKIALVFHNTWKTAMPIEQMKMNLIQKKEHKQQQFSEQADIVYFT